MRKFFLTALSLGLLQVLAVSCYQSNNNQKTTLSNEPNTSVSNEMSNEYVSEPYDPEKFALDAGRGELRNEYFGIKLSDLKKHIDKCVKDACCESESACYFRLEESVEVSSKGSGSHSRSNKICPAE